MNTTDSRIAVFQSILDTEASKLKFDSLLPGSYDTNTNTFTVTGLKDSDIVITQVSGNTFDTQMSTTKTYVYVSSDGNPLNNTQIQSLSTNFVPEFEQAGFTNGEILVFLPR